MGIEENKAVARKWIEAWNMQDLDAIAGLYPDEGFYWRISGLSPVSNTYGKAEAIDLIRRTFAAPMQKRHHLEIKHVTAEEDRVAVEAVASAINADGSPFQNFYHILFTVRDGKIAHGHAYFDTWVAVNSSMNKAIASSS